MIGIVTLISSVSGSIAALNEIGWIDAKEIFYVFVDGTPESTIPEPSPSPPPPPPPEPTPPPPPPPPEPTPPPPPPPDDILFKDEFSDASKGWPHGSVGGRGYGYVNGLYRMYIYPSPLGPSGSNWHVMYPALGPTNLRDVMVEVDVVRSGNAPSVASAWGITCRLVDRNNFYTMGTRSDGSYYISIMKDGILNRLAHGGPGSAIRPDTSQNHIRAVCTGSTLALYVNGRKLDEVEDTYLKSGGVGLFENNNAATGPATDVMFDYFLVRKP